MQGLDSFVVIVTAIGLGIAAAIGAKLDSYLPAVTLALLALISSSLVRIHFRMASIDRASAVPSGILESRRMKFDDILNRVDRSSEVWMWGAILTRHIPLLENAFKQGSTRGLKSKILLIQPNSSAIGMLAFRAVRPHGSADAQAGVPYVAELHRKAQHLNERLENHIGMLESIKQSPSAASLEYRTIDYLSPYVIFAFDPYFPQGTLVVCLAFHAGEADLQPTLWLGKEKDGYWFEYFMRQFEYCWQAAGSISSEGGWSSAGTPDV